MQRPTRREGRQPKAQGQPGTGPAGGRTRLEQDQLDLFTPGSGVSPGGLAGPGLPSFPFSLHGPLHSSGSIVRDWATTLVDYLHNLVRLDGAVV